MVQIDYDLLAIAEARKAWRRYARLSGVLATRFEAAYRAASAKLQTNISALAPYLHGTRVVRLKGYPYLLVLKDLTASRVLVVALAHTSRRPGYWRRRLP